MMSRIVDQGIQMIVRRGNLLPEDHEQLGTPEAYFNPRDIPFIISKGMREKAICATDCTDGVQYRGGGWYSDYVEVNHVVKDCVTCWTGDIHIKQYRFNHDLPVFYSVRNHPDDFQVFDMDPDNGYARHLRPVRNITVERAVGENSNSLDKRGFQFTGESRYENINMFPKGVWFTAPNNPRNPWFLTLTNGTDVEIGSAEFPIDPRKTSGKGIRLGGIKKAAPDSKHIIIHAYRGLRIDLSAQARRETTIIFYSRKWSRQERINYEFDVLGRLAFA